MQRTDPTKSDVSVRVNNLSMYLTAGPPVQNLIERRDALTRQIEREQTRLDQLLAQTWARRGLVAFLFPGAGT